MRRDLSMQRAPARPPRLHCEAVLSPGASVELTERAARHVAALRLHQPATRSCSSTATARSRPRRWSRSASAASWQPCANGDSSTANRRCEIHLAQGICAGDRMDLVLQKATELGVASIQPVVTARSIVRLARERQEKRETHWQNVVIAACEQCGRNRIPPVAPSTACRSSWRCRPAAARGSCSPRTARRRSPRARDRGAGDGADRSGGRARARGAGPSRRARGFTAVRFGPRILRTETAPLAALAALQALYGDC